MAIIDPRLEMARRARNGARAGNVVSLRQMLQPGVAGPQRAADTSRTEMNSLENYARTRFQDTGRELEALKIARGQQKQADPGGFQGLLVDILENPVTKTILKPLQILDVPRRAVISGIHELSDAIGSGDASWDDFMSQAKDPNYGVGQYIDTGNKWVDRALGFIGDVALDPLTYATLGASKAAGASGRLALSSNMLRKGMSAERAATVARVGRSALTAAERSELGLKRAGVYFFGKRLAERRLPMSGGVGSMTEKGLAGLRLAATDRGVGKFLQRAFTPDVNKTARLQVLRGELPAGEAAQFIQTIESRNIQRAAAGEAQALSQVELGELVKLANPDLRASVYQVLDGAREATDAERPLVDAVRSWLNAKWDDIKGRMTAADPQSGFGKIEDRYLPWMRTEAAHRYQSDPTSPYLGELKKGFDDGDPLSVFNHRSLASKVNAGESVDWFGTKLTKEDLYVDRLNELARAGGFSGDFFETDIVTILERYAMQHAEQAGLAARYGALKAVGVMDTLDSKLVRREVFDEDAVAAQVGRVKSFAKQHADAHAEASAAVAKLRDELDNSGSAIAQRLKAIENQRFDAATIASNLRPEVDGLQKALGSASVKLQASYDELHRLFDGAVPEVAEASAAGALRAQRLLDGLFDDVGALLGDTPGVSVKELKRQLDKVGREVTELGRQQARMVEFNEAIAANWDRVSAGTPTGNKYIDDIGMSLGMLKPTAAFQSRAGKKAAAVGEFQTWAKNELPKTSWWGRVSGRPSVKLAPANVAALTRAEVERILVNASASTVGLPDLRTAAAWVLARDEKFYGGLADDAPMVAAREALLSKLDEAADADDLSRRLAAVETRELGQIQRRSVQMNVDAAELEDVIRRAEGDVEAVRRAREVLRVGVIDDDLVLDETMKANLRKAITDLSSKEFVIGQGVSARKYKLKDFFGGSDMPSRAQFDLSAMSEKFTFSAEDAERWRRYGSPARVKADLADTLQHYYAVSDIQHRFNLSARMMAWSGLVPSEAMLRSSVAASAKQWAEHWDGRMAQLLKSQEVLTGLRDEWGRRAPTLANNPGAVADELRRMFDEAFARPGGESLRQFVGPALAAAEDPKVMLKKARHTAYRNEVVKPWYEANYGKWQGLEAAKARLREAKAAGRSPFAARATLEDAQAFLTDLIGGTTRTKRISARSVGQTVTDNATWKSATAGTLFEEFRRTEAQQRLFHALLDPGVDVDAVLQGSGVGSFYAGALKRAADDIDAMALRGPRAPQVPAGTDASFVAAARKDMDRLRRRKNSVDYDIALGDQELHEGIMDLARFDLWRAQSADGRPGFFMPDGTQVVDAQGAPLVFSKVEADSLFQAPMTAEQAKQVRSRMGSISNELGQARKNLEGLLASPNYKRNGEIRPYLFPQKQELEQNIRAMSEELRDLRNAAEASLPQTQAAALAKVQLLMAGDLPWSKANPNTYSFLAESPLKVSARREGQAAVHATTPSRKLLDEVEELDKSVTVNAWRGWAGNTVAVRQHTDTMRSVAAQREAQIAEMQLAVRQAELAIPLAEKRERAYQLMNSFNEKVDTAREAAIVAARGEREAASAVIGQTEKTLAVVGHKYDTARAVVDEMNELMQTTVPRLQERLGVVEKALTDAPVKASADSIDWLQSARQELEMVVSNPEDPISKVVANAIDLEADWLISGQKLAQAQSFLNDLERGKVDWVVEFEKARDGWKTMDAAGLPGLQAPRQIADMLVSMQRIEQPGFAREVNRLFGNYTRFFKSYATLSPGFHVRNIMSNSFVLVASGADPRALTQGFGLWKGLRQSIRDGKGVDTWLATLPEADRAVAEVAARTMFAAGGGHTSDQVADLLRVGKGKVLDNKVLRASQKVGDSYESASRFMLAYDTAVSAVKNGQAPDINEAAARVKQFLFDYRDLSVADQNMRAVVPFWIWMSRNLPMQIMNQWANPKAYAGYNSLMRNIAEPGDDNDIMPSWLDEQGGVKIGEDLYLRPDLGFTRLGEQLAEIGDLPRLLSYVNPAMRVPVEVLGSRQLYNDVPFSENPQTVAGGPLSGPLGSLAEVLGLGERNAEGQVVVDPRVNHVLKNMLPPLAQAERLMPSSAVGVDRQSNSALGYLGVPVTRVTPSMKASELARRKREMEELALSSSRLGFQP